MSGKLTR